MPSSAAARVRCQPVSCSARKMNCRSAVSREKSLRLVSSPAWRRVLGVLLAVGALGLSCHFTELVHTSQWTGNPNWDGALSAITNSYRRSVPELMGKIDDADEEYRPSWLRELPVWEQLEQWFEIAELNRRQIGRTWHTWFTGLYPVKLIRQDFWFPGGTLAEGLAEFELRDRPGP